MKNSISAKLLVLLSLAMVGKPVLADLSIFACEPEWASLAREIGGDQIDVATATHARQDPHYIRAKPSLLAAMRKADLVVCSGAGLEAGWLPVLLQKSGRASVQPGSPGYLEAASVLILLEKPLSLDRAQGDVHPQGNPHVHLNPRNIVPVAEALLERMQQLDAGNADLYEKRFTKFLDRWKAATESWQEAAGPLRNVPLVVHHKSFVYLLDWLGMREIGALESRPGIPPTSAHLESLLKTLRANPAKMILRTPYDPADASEWLADKTGVPALVLPYTVGGDDQSADLFGLFESTVSLLLEAAGAE